MKVLFIFFSFLISISVLAQKETNMWYFNKNAGLDFNSGIPIPLTDGKLNREFGSAVISDENGNLLFYTDGVTVWNRNHDTLSNGKDLSGNSSAIQPALIVQDVKKSFLYYIFTADWYQGSPNGFRYSLVDMRQDGGLGVIAVKNELLLYPSVGNVTAVLNANNVDIWIVTHEEFTDAFYSYQLTAFGLNETPVISHIKGTEYDNYNGDMRLAPGGKKLAMALDDTIGIFDFDNVTGIVSNPLIIDMEEPSPIAVDYGLAFSSDGTKLYYTYTKTTHTTICHTVNKVYQVDLSAGDNNQIKNSIVQVFVDSVDTPLNVETGIFDMALGPDGKIYIIDFGTQYLDVINAPNEKGLACNYVENGLYLGGKTLGCGLPNFAPVYSTVKFVSTNTCTQDTTHFSISNTNNISSVLWDFGEPSSTSNSSTKLNPYHIYNDTGTYNISLTIIYPNDVSRTIRDSIHIDQSPPLSLLGNDTSICRGSTLNYNLSNFYFYVWNDGSVNPDFTISSAGTFWTEATLGKCKRRDSLTIKYYPIPSLSKDTTLCTGGTLRLNVNENNATYLWNNGTTNSYLDVFTPGTYSVQVTDKCGTFTAEKTIKSVYCGAPYIPNLLTSNNDGLNEMLVISGIEEGQWKLELFNRWGDRVFQSNDYHNELNGQQLEEGIYYYSLSKQGKPSYKGWLQVMR